MPRVAWVYAAFATIFLVVGLQQAGQPYVIDEAVFPFVSAAVAETGRPVFYNGVLGPESVGIWHPPGYVYALASWIVAFGDSHTSVRAFGLVAALLTGGLVARLVRAVRPQSPPVIAALVFGLYLIHPLVVQSALVPDIDGTVGVLAVAACLAVAVQLIVSDRRERWHVPLAALVLFLSFWTKLTTSLALIPVFILALRPGANGRRGWARDSLIVIDASVGGFLVTWWLLSTVTGVDFLYPLAFTIASFLKGGVGDQSVGELVSRLLPTEDVWFWTAPLFIMLSLVGVVLAFARWRLPADRGLRLVALVGIGIFLAYDLVAESPFGFPKYWVAAVPAMAVLCGAVLADAVDALAAARWRLGGSARAVTWIAAAAVGMVMVALAHIFFARPASDAYAPSATSDGSLAIGVVFVAVTAGLIIALVRLPSRPPVVPAVLALALYVAVLAIDLGLVLAQRSADYSVRYYYGQTGTAQAIADIKGITDPDDVILAAKDIGLESGRPFYEDALVFADIGDMGALIDSGDVELIVTRCTWNYAETVFPDAFAVIREHAIPVVADNGSDYVLWRPRARAGNEATIANEDLCRD